MISWRLYFAAALLLAGPAWARVEIANVDFNPSGRSGYEISGVFDPPPPSGFAPIRIAAVNDTDSNTNWAVDFDWAAGGSKYRSSFNFPVPARGTEVRQVLVPVAVNYSNPGYGHNQVVIVLNAGGLGRREHYLHPEVSGALPAIAIGKVLADNARSRLEAEVEARMRTSSRYGTDTFGSRFDAEDLPEDWRALSGFDFLMLTDVEWRAMSSGARVAVIQWVRLGGKLHLYMGPGATAASLDIPAEYLTDGRKMSFGGVRLVNWDGKSLDAKATVDRYWNADKRMDVLTSGYSASPFSGTIWPLLEALGDRGFASWQVLVFLVIFGILVGPVNLFVLAPTSRRHRLFVTTPLLSVGASVIMIGILLFQDGVGGAGHRFVSVNLEPGETTAYVTQEQASRTGLLFGSGYTLRPGAVVEAVALPDKAWVKLKNTHDSQQAQFALSEQGYTGNFFQSRAEQGQLLRAALPTRARLELKAATAPDAPPQLVSAFGFPVAELFYIDASGVIWRSTAAVATGQPVTLAKSDTDTLRAWWKAACAQAGTSMRNRLADLPRSNGMFFAKAAAAPDFTLDTLNSIRWSEDEVVVFGTVPNP